MKNRNDLDKNENLSDENKLGLLINGSVTIENNIKDIKTLNEKLKKCNNLNET